MARILPIYLPAIKWMPFYCSWSKVSKWPYTEPNCGPNMPKTSCLTSRSGVIWRLSSPKMWPSWRKRCDRSSKKKYILIMFKVLNLKSKCASCHAVFRLEILPLPPVQSTKSSFFSLLQCYLPFQSIYITAIDREIDNSNSALTTSSLLMGHKFLEVYLH